VDIKLWDDLEEESRESTPVLHGRGRDESDIVDRGYLGRG
jgi:hypothetical protein